ncbi:MAG TPA: sigma-70 family RNA polymerase sigma factor [Solirubrobacterales bacterium]|nr:sigma-70 family RNA polymerase sigma factor [Solirubrobacterales bacterium]
MHTSASAIAESRRPHAGRLSQASLLHQSDERLVALARSGSERAWAEITRRYGRQLRVYCTRFVGASRAEDAVQQTFLQAFLALRDGAHREIALRAWLYRIAHNCSIDLLRKGNSDYDELDLDYDGVAQPPTLFEQREEIRRLVSRMRDLPEAQRQALALRELEGRSYEEISAQLGHTGSGVRQLIFRARTALRNSAPGFLPIGFLKARLSQPLPVECHHVATAVSVPASSGTGMDVVGAATLAVVAVLGGGLAASDGGSRRARPVQVQRAAPQPGPVSVSPAAQSAAARPPRTGGSSLRATRRGTRGPDPAPAAAEAPAAVPAAVAPPPVVLPAPVPAPAEPAAPVAPAGQAPPADDVRQQALPSTPPAPAEATAPQPAGGSVPASAPTAVPVTPAPGGNAGTGKQPPPAKPRRPVVPAKPKPVAPAPPRAPAKGPAQKPAPAVQRPQAQRPGTKPVPPRRSAPARSGERR